MTEVYKTIGELGARVDKARASGGGVGLVPTMGALHAGHRALLERARAECDLVVCSIYVNPLQFNRPGDLAAYPRDLDADLLVLDELGADCCFAPSDAEMYPRDPQVAVDPGPLGDLLEGAARPGHFRGVATVVTKLFALTGRCRAYFGEKDYQQLVVVRGLITDLSLPVELVAVETVREPDGLALSSRNVRLGPAARAAAPVLHTSLLAGAELAAPGADPAVIEAAMAGVCASEPLVDLDYAVVRTLDLAPVEQVAGPLRLLIAADVDGVRLIDNLEVRA